jgi:hypothetical protein
MENEKNTMGFQADLPTQWDSNIDGIPRYFSNHQGDNICGVLIKIDKKIGYAFFKPSITYNLNGSEAHINEGEPAKIPLPIGAIRPLPNNMTLEECVADYNRRKRDGEEGKRKGLIILP